MSAHSITSRGLAGRKIPQGTLTPIGALLFAASEPGAWYDVADMSTLFQDSAGATPVTALEQQVGRMLDKSGRGNHATQVTATKRPVFSRRYQLTNNEGQFLTLSAFTCTTTNVGSPPGIANNTLITPTAVPSVPTVSVVAGGTSITFTAYLKQVAPVGLNMLVRNTTTSTNLGSAEVISSAGTPNVNAVSVGDGWYKYTITQSSGIQSGNTVAFYLGRIDATPEGQSWRVAGVSIVETTDAHLPYQRVTTAADYDADPAKFPAYLRFDGVDDALKTASINFTSTDKMTVWAGYSSESLSTIQYLATNDFNPGRFTLIHQQSTNSQFESRGSTGSGYAAAPAITGAHVLCGIGNISGNSSILRRDGVQVGQSASLQGAATYALAPLIIGSNGPGNLNFNGRLYSLIVRGAQTPLSQIEATELYIKQKMRMP